MHTPQNLKLNVIDLSKKEQKLGLKYLALSRLRILLFDKQKIKFKNLSLMVFKIL
jgi:hypothetical protein